VTSPAEHSQSWQWFRRAAVQGLGIAQTQSAAADFDHFQLQTLAYHAKRVLTPVLAVEAVMAWLLPLHSGVAVGLMLWLVVAFLMLARYWFSRRYLQSTALLAKAGYCRDRMAAFNFFIGCSSGAFCWFGFPGAEPLLHAAMTIILVGLGAGAVATCASSRRSFIAFAGPLFLQLALAWLFFGQAQAYSPYENPLTDSGIGLQYVFATAIFALFWVLLAACDDSETWVRRACLASQMNADLASQLKTVNTELTEQREAALAANQAKTRFLAAASHDLRQPLHALSLYSASLSLQVLPPRAQQLADSIQSSVTQALAPLLDALLDMSKLDARLIEPVLNSFWLKESLDSVHQEFTARAQAKGLAFYWDLPPRLAVHSDARLLTQIVRNIGDNALKYTEVGAIRCSARTCGSHVIFQIADSGIGIAAADAQRVFEEFYQCGNAERDRSKGLGLGLAIVKRLSDLLQMRLTLSSKRGQGTTVTFWIQADLEAGVASARGAGELEKVPSLAKRVLIVDNESMIRDSTRALLETWGCTVHCANGLEEALRATVAEPFDVLVSDYRLNAMENGLQVLRQLSLRQPFAKCWLVTGETTNLPWAELKDNNIQVMHKPLVARVFLEALRAP
jgi:two-component system, sensor histidine kinase